jgi:hypothetical protein
MPTLPELSTPTWLAISAGLAGLLGSLLGIVVSLVRLRSAIKDLRKGFQEVLVKSGSQLDVSLVRSALQVQRYRLAQHNLTIEGSVELISHHNPSMADPDERQLAEPYVVARLALTNQGDRPVDLLACLVAGREVSNRSVHGLGLQGGELSWDALVPYYWNDSHEPSHLELGNSMQLDGTAPGPTEATDPPLFQGISTTGSLFRARSNLIRLDPGECDDLFRMDRLTNVEQLVEADRIHLLYKVFVVVVGYPLHLLEGANTSSELTQLQALVLRQHTRRWRSIQYTLNNLNRFPFRLALEGASDPFASDPLGRLTTPTRWRCFLLHHWDFEELTGRGPAGAPDPVGTEREQLRRNGRPASTIEEVGRDIRERFGVFESDADAASLEAARALCREKLDLLVRAWDDLNRTIRHCGEPGVGFAQLIKESPYKERWEALLREGYVLTPPNGSDANTLALPTSSDTHTHTLDPLAFERFSLRTKYVLATISPRPVAP